MSGNTSPLPDSDLAMDNTTSLNALASAAPSLTPSAVGLEEELAGASREGVSQALKPFDGMSGALGHQDAQPQSPFTLAMRPAGEFPALDFEIAGHSQISNIQTLATALHAEPNETHRMFLLKRYWHQVHKPAQEIIDAWYMRHAGYLTLDALGFTKPELVEDFNQMMDPIFEQAKVAKSRLKEDQRLMAKKDALRDHIARCACLRGHAFTQYLDYIDHARTFYENLSKFFQPTVTSTEIIDLRKVIIFFNRALLKRFGTTIAANKAILDYGLSGVDIKPVPDSIPGFYDSFTKGLGFLPEVEYVDLQFMKEHGLRFHPSGIIEYGKFEDGQVVEWPEFPDEAQPQIPRVVFEVPTGAAVPKSPTTAQPPEGPNNDHPSSVPAQAPKSPVLDAPRQMSFDFDHEQRVSPRQSRRFNTDFARERGRVLDIEDPSSSDDAAGEDDPQSLATEEVIDVPQQRTQPPGESRVSPQKRKLSDAFVFQPPTTSTQRRNPQRVDKITSYDKQQGVLRPKTPRRPTVRGLRLLASCNNDACNAEPEWKLRVHRDNWPNLTWEEKMDTLMLFEEILKNHSNTQEDFEAKAPCGDCLRILSDLCSVNNAGTPFDQVKRWSAIALVLKRLTATNFEPAWLHASTWHSFRHDDPDIQRVRKLNNPAEMIAPIVKQQAPIDLTRASLAEWSEDHLFADISKIFQWLSPDYEPEGSSAVSATQLREACSDMRGYFEQELDMHRFHSSDIESDTHEMPFMYHTLLMQAVLSFPGLFVAMVQLRRDNNSRLIAYPSCGLRVPAGHEFRGLTIQGHGSKLQNSEYRPIFGEFVWSSGEKPLQFQRVDRKEYANRLKMYFDDAKSVSFSIQDNDGYNEMSSARHIYELLSGRLMEELTLPAHLAPTTSAEERISRGAYLYEHTVAVRFHTLKSHATDRFSFPIDYVTVNKDGVCENGVDLVDISRAWTRPQPPHVNRAGVPNSGSDLMFSAVARLRGLGLVADSLMAIEDLDNEEVIEARQKWLQMDDTEYEEAVAVYLVKDLAPAVAKAFAYIKSKESERWPESGFFAFQKSGKTLKDRELKKFTVSKPLDDPSPAKRRKYEQAKEALDDAEPDSDDHAMDVDEELVVETPKSYGVKVAEDVEEQLVVENAEEEEISPAPASHSSTIDSYVGDLDEWNDHNRVKDQKLRDARHAARLIAANTSNVEAPAPEVPVTEPEATLPQSAPPLPQLLPSKSATQKVMAKEAEAVSVENLMNQAKLSKEDAERAMAEGAGPRRSSRRKKT